jgi:hypothetical protein
MVMGEEAPRSRDENGEGNDDMRCIKDEGWDGDEDSSSAGQPPQTHQPFHFFNTNRLLRLKPWRHSCFNILIISSFPQKKHTHPAKMHPTEILLLTLLATPATAHGVVTMVRGANGVDMPGLSGTSPPLSPPQK